MKVLLPGLLDVGGPNRWWHEATRVTKREGKISKHGNGGGEVKKKKKKKIGQVEGEKRKSRGWKCEWVGFFLFFFWGGISFPQEGMATNPSQRRGGARQ